MSIFANLHSLAPQINNAPYPQQHIFGKTVLETQHRASSLSDYVSRLNQSMPCYIIHIRVTNTTITGSKAMVSNMHHYKNQHKMHHYEKMYGFSDKY